MSNATNHPGTGHRKGNVKKQFFRVRGESRIRWIGNQADWRHVHRTGVPIVCPDQDCAQQMKAIQRTKPALRR
ncbi:hypothetical protein [Nesterenkonia halobia]|uniref:Uncharacterized protein n=1 Tax=Nesterenkonia halobia TaxID=37922 RepID=A0ABP6R869_9MICC